MTRQTGRRAWSAVPTVRKAGRQRTGFQRAVMSLPSAEWVLKAERIGLRRKRMMMKPGPIVVVEAPLPQEERMRREKGIGLTEQNRRPGRGTGRLETGFEQRGLTLHQTSAQLAKVPQVAPEMPLSGRAERQTPTAGSEEEAAGMCRAVQRVLRRRAEGMYPFC